MTPTTAESSRAVPATILFDGVCNLCNSSVQWVIERDRKKRFSFASLQSQAAARLLADTEAVTPAAPSGDPLESLVLVDGSGVHRRSDAALRIARGLGFPWSLAAAAAIVPRPLRDGLYSLVARNRYRWFGSREACWVPAPELRARFLDAEEPVEDRLAASPASASLPAAHPSSAGSAEAPPAAESPTRAASDAPGSQPGPLWTFSLRWVLVYILVYVFPFPLGSLPDGAGIPGTGWLPDRFTALMHAFVPWLGHTLFGVDIRTFPAGSGDTTYNYVEILAYAALSLLGAAVWSVLRRGRPVTPLTLDRCTVYVRYYLATIMLHYGLDKLLLLQFAAPGPSRLMITYGESSPFGLLWTSLGASAPYQAFGGLAEVAGAILLLWRRTALLGALVTAGVLVNVVALNFSYDVPVKIFSSHLLLLALFVAAPFLARLLAILLFNLPTAAATLRPFPVRSAGLRRTLLAAKLLFVGWILFGQGWDLLQRVAPIRRIPAHRPLHGFYQVESCALGGVRDRALPDERRWVRMGIDARGEAAVRMADGSVATMDFAVDEAKRTVTLAEPGDPKPTVWTYGRPSPGTITLDGNWKGATASLRLREIKEPPVLTSRGFRWINEFPFYR